MNTPKDTWLIAITLTLLFKLAQAPNLGLFIIMTRQPEQRGRRRNRIEDSLPAHQAQEALREQVMPNQ
jgi:hypothetical protein